MKGALEAASALAIYAFTPQGMRLALRIAEKTAAHIYAPASLRHLTAPKECDDGNFCCGSGDLPRLFSENTQNANPAVPPAPDPYYDPGQAARQPAQIIFFDALAPQISANFKTYACHIFISACGMAGRARAPHLEAKKTDRAGLVIDQAGRRGVSLLAGHVGGAKRAAFYIAGILEAEPIITTATDIERLPALDSLAGQNRLKTSTPERIKHVSAALLASRKVALHDPENYLGLRGSGWEHLFTLPPRDWTVEQIFASETAPQTPYVLVTEKVIPDLSGPGTAHLVFHPPVIFAGIGCKRHTPADHIIDCVADAFASAGLSPCSLAVLASYEAKQDEPGLIQAARDLKVDLLFFTAQDLHCFPVTTISKKAQEIFGVPGVAEPAALAAATQAARSAKKPHAAELIVSKKKYPGVTLALARIAAPDSDVV